MVGAPTMAIARICSIAIVFLSYQCSITVSSFSITDKPVSTLLRANSEAIASLKKEAQTIAEDNAPNSDVYYLRYILNDFKSEDQRISSLKSNMEWRCKEGKVICDSAKKAYLEATSGDGWNNDPIRSYAPHAEIVNKYLKSSNVMTTLTKRDDIMYCIRAGAIDDVKLMSEVTADQLIEFFIYAREVLSNVANERSVQCDRLLSVCTANDLRGLNLLGGDPKFRTALGGSSTKSSELYPALSGPTLLLNLPKVLGALLQVFTPLFPEKVRKKLRFEQGPLSDVEDYSDISRGGKDLGNFQDQLEEILYKN